MTTAPLKTDARGYLLWSELKLRDNKDRTSVPLSDGALDPRYPLTPIHISKAAGGSATNNFKRLLKNAEAGGPFNSQEDIHLGAKRDGSLGFKTRLSTLHF